MQTSCQLDYTVSDRARAYAHEDIKLNSISILNDSTSSNSCTVKDEPIIPVKQPVVYESSWYSIGHSSMAADVRIPSFLIPCSASQLMDARYKSRKFSSVIADDRNSVSPAA